MSLLQWDSGKVKGQSVSVHQGVTQGGDIPGIS